MILDTCCFSLVKWNNPKFIGSCFINYFKMFLIEILSLIRYKILFFQLIIIFIPTSICNLYINIFFFNYLKNLLFIIFYNLRHKVALKNRRTLEQFNNDASKTICTGLRWVATTLQY